MKKLNFGRFFRDHLYNKPEMNRRDVSIYDSEGNIIWEQKHVEAPADWSDTAVGIAASKYFYRAIPENSITQLIQRITKTIATFGEENGYFDKPSSAKVFQEELAFLLQHQYAAFNSPVWFNCGLWHEYGIDASDSQDHFYYNLETNKVNKTDKAYLYPQNSACFIQSVDDTLDSMMKLQQSEVSLFKFGSGSGTNFSKIRGLGETLSSGGQSSGVISFLRGFDTWAGSIKSGGTTRRSAKMVLLDVDHPEIIDFIQWKAKEEEKAHALIKEGYDSHFTGEAYATVSGQNSNNSIRVPDDFMNAAKHGELWSTYTRTHNTIYKTYPAREILDEIAKAAWQCADPGIQFQDTINKWHTCKETDTINASNPCSEYLFLDDSACNLASLNLIKFLDPETLEFNVWHFNRAVRILITAMDIIVDLSSYPTHKIAKRSHDFRPLGLGFANLGGMLMRLGIPYDSEIGRFYGASIAALLSSQGYLTSKEIAQAKGAFEGHEQNKECMNNVMWEHAKAAQHMKSSFKELYVEEKDISINAPLYTERLRGNLKHLITEAANSWAKVPDSEEGYRNSQISVIAPTGTIGLLMDCATTGIEPDFSLIKYKQLSGGGQFQIVNPICEAIIKDLGYDEPALSHIIDYIKEKNTIIGAPEIPLNLYPIFDCAVGDRALSPDAHLDMIAAVQPYISGAISKTVNLPHEATVDDIKNLYFKAWVKGVKCLAVYRDGCKSSQPLNAAKNEEAEQEESAAPVETQRKRLPDTRSAIAHKFSVGGQEVYMHIGLYDDGSPGEIFLRTSKEGSLLKGLLDGIAILISLNLQHGVPLESIIEKLRYGRFEPYGFTGNSDIPSASSILDYVGQFLSRYLVNEEDEKIEEEHKQSEEVCLQCGSLMTVNGTCYYCQNCGSSSGCS